MRQIRARLLIPFAVTALSLAACSSQPTSTSRAEMEAQASAAFNRMRADVPLVTDRQTIDFVACVAQSVVDVLEPPYNDIEWELAIFESDSVNAFAMPGGKIGVFSGILKVTENEHQLAAVIGHEIAHVTLNHSAERASRAGLTNFGINAIAIILGGGYTGATYTAQQALYAGATFGITLPYSRGRETEADTVGLDYMARAGFDPRESVPLWQRMGEGAGSAPAEFMSTHPAPDTRIENLISLWKETLPLYNQAIAEGRQPDCGGQSPRYVKDLKPKKEAN
jgi:predicted Zn-dependent protease